MVSTVKYGYMRKVIRLGLGFYHSCTMKFIQLCNGKSFVAYWCIKGLVRVEG